MSYDTLKKLNIATLIIQILVAGACTICALMAVGGNGPFSDRDNMPLILALVAVLFVCLLSHTLLNRRMRKIQSESEAQPDA